MNIEETHPLVPPRIKNLLQFVVKIVIIIVIFKFLVSKGLLDFVKLKETLVRIDLFVIAFILVFFGALIAVQRWRLLLNIHQVSIGRWTAIKLTFVGLFFNIAFPGGVGGDFVRAYYISRGEREKTILITSVFLDRLLGVYSMFLIAAVGSVYFAAYGTLSEVESVRGHEYLEMLVIFVLSVFAFLTLTVVFFMSTRVRRSRVTEWVLTRIPFKRSVSRIYDVIHHYSNNRMLAFKALLLSCVSQLVVFIGMYCLGVVLSVDKLSVTDYLFILPVGFVVNSIPLAPGGLGIGEAGFSALFLLFGSPEGAEFGLLFHIIFFILALGVGGLIYLFTDLSYKN